ncbi:MAG TPA: hypothetical protein VIL86_19560 [Tepidisphaeraceae bacterium]|jgi:hypothetical protein
MHRCVLCVLILLAVASAWANAQTTQSSVVSVVAAGIGKTGKDAEKDALSNAVRQAIGAFVSAETLVENDELVRDKILTLSDGFVEQYHVIGKPRSTPEGLTGVVIKAQVRRGKLVETVRANDIAVVEVNGQDLYGRAVTKKEQAKDGADAVLQAFRDVPERLLKTEILGKPAYDEKTGKFNVDVQVAVDQEAYFIFAKELMRGLDVLAPDPIILSSVRHELTKEGDHGIKVFHFSGKELPQKFFDESPHQDPKLGCILMCERMNLKAQSSRWRCYIFDVDLMKRILRQSNTLNVIVELQAVDGTIIDKLYRPVGGEDPKRPWGFGPITPMNAVRGMASSDKDTTLLLCPFMVPPASVLFLSNEPFIHMGEEFGRGRVGALPEWQYKANFDLNPDEVKQVAKVVCRLAPSDNAAKNLELNKRN